MSTIKRLAVILIITISMTGCSSEQSEFSVSSQTKILAFGDSLTEGYGAPSGQSYPDHLAGILGASVINAGISGETSAEALRRLPSELDGHQPDILILITGGNDILRNQSRAELANNLKKMISIAQERDVAVLMASVPEKALFLSANPLYLEVAEQMSVPIAEDLLADLLSDAEMKSDSVHLNALGYQKMAEGLAKQLR